VVSFDLTIAHEQIHWQDEIRPPGKLPPSFWYKDILDTQSARLITIPTVESYLWQPGLPFSFLRQC
jgi:hypothetical protein